MEPTTYSLARANIDAHKHVKSIGLSMYAIIGYFDTHCTFFILYLVVVALIREGDCGGMLPCKIARLWILENGPLLHLFTELFETFQAHFELIPVSNFSSKFLRHPLVRERFLGHYNCKNTYKNFL